MSFRPFPDGVSVPLVNTRALAAAQAFLTGALLVVDANGAYAECGADPAAINAVALGSCGADTSGFNILGKKEFPPGFMQAVYPGNSLLFSCRFVGSVPANNTGQFGTIKDTDGLWKIDFNEVTVKTLNLVGRLTASPESQNRVIVSFIPAAVVLPA